MCLLKEAKFVGVDKCEKCWTISLSWYGKDFGFLCKLRRESATFRAEWEEAEANYSKKLSSTGLQFPVSMGVSTFQRSGMRVEATYYFCTVAQFRKYFSLDPKNLGLKISNLSNEQGTQELKGVLFKPSDGMSVSLDFFRKVTLFNETVFSLDEHLRRPEDRLRDAEPKQVFSQLGKEKAAARSSDTQPKLAM